MSVQEGPLIDLKPKSINIVAYDKLFWTCGDKPGSKKVSEKIPDFSEQRNRHRVGSKGIINKLTIWE